MSGLFRSVDFLGFAGLFCSQGGAVLFAGCPFVARDRRKKLIKAPSQEKQPDQDRNRVPDQRALRAGVLWCIHGIFLF